MFWSITSNRSCLTISTIILSAAFFLSIFLPQVVSGDDWPQWRGPRHNDISREKSLWPGGWPPVRLWEKNVGKGCSSPVVVKGRLYVMGWKGDKRKKVKGRDIVYCFNAQSGKKIWAGSYASPYQGRYSVGDTGQYGGPSSTPTFDIETGYLFTLGIDGDLCCWDTKKHGLLVWSINFYNSYNIPQRPKISFSRRDYGYSSSPLLQGELVIAEVGAHAGTLVAFDKRNGKKIWNSKCGIPAGHNGGPVPLTIGGISCIATHALGKLVIVRTDQKHLGQTLAQYDWPVDFSNNIATPAVYGNRILLTSGYNQSRSCLLEINTGSVRELWNCRKYSKVCSPVIYKGSVYMVNNSLYCIDFKTGKLKWRGGRFNLGSCIITAGDDKVIVFGRHNLALVEACPADNSYHELSSLKGVLRATCYPHVTLSDGLIFCKDRDGNMACFSVRDRSKE